MTNVNGNYGTIVLPVPINSLCNITPKHTTMYTIAFVTIVLENSLTVGIMLYIYAYWYVLGLLCICKTKGKK